MLPVRLLLFLGAVCLAVACGPPPTPNDADGGAGALDSGVDAGTPDSGIDAGSSDAGTPDSGIDAGSSDAGTSDAGTDAGPHDAGCRAAAECRSSVCLASGECLHCQADVECGPGRVCGTGRCVDACTGAGPCDGGLCCAGRCVDPQVDPLHCGGCAAPCASGAFCAAGLCRAAAADTLCARPSPTALLDGYDDDAGRTLAQALAVACDGGWAEAHQADSGLLDTATGEPLSPSDLLCVAGGSFRQRAVAWLEASGLAPVRDTSTATDYRYTQADGGVAAQGALSTLSASHDVVILQVVATPAGAVVVNAAGYFGEGTHAAAWYFANVLVPQLSALSDGWFVVDWQDTNANTLPDALDTWTVLAQGR